VTPFFRTRCIYNHNNNYFGGKDRAPFTSSVEQTDVNRVRRQRPWRGSGAESLVMQYAYIAFVYRHFQPQPTPQKFITDIMLALYANYHAIDNLHLQTDVTISQTVSGLTTRRQRMQLPPSAAGRRKNRPKITDKR